MASKIFQENAFQIIKEAYRRGNIKEWRKHTFQEFEPRHTTASHHIGDVIRGEPR